MIPEEESLLLQKAKEGDEGSFEALILSCKGKAYNIALRYMKNENDAMDALQESFIKIFRNLAKFNGASRFDTWAYRIVVNTCNDLLRKNKQKYNELPLDGGEEGDGPSFEIPDSQPPPEEAAIRREECSYILSCLDKIPAEHKEAIILRDIQGFSYDEIAEILQCSMGTVKSRISRARSRLKEVYLNNNP